MMAGVRMFVGRSGYCGHGGLAWSLPYGGGELLREVVESHRDSTGRLPPRGARQFIEKD